MHHAHHLAGLFLNGSRTLGQGVSRYRQDGVGISTAPLVNVDSMPSVMAAPSTPPLPASAGLAALPVIESPEGARVTIGGRHYDCVAATAISGCRRIRTCSAPPVKPRFATGLNCGTIGGWVATRVCWSGNAVR